MAVNYILPLHGSLETLENPTMAGDRPADLLAQWKDLLEQENLGDIAKELTKFEKTFAKGDPRAIGKGLRHLGHVVLEASKKVDDHTVTDHLQQLSGALTKVGAAYETDPEGA